MQLSIRGTRRFCRAKRLAGQGREVGHKIDPRERGPRSIINVIGLNRHSFQYG